MAQLQYLTITQIANLWVEAGGLASNMVDAVAVALAESGGNREAISPSHDYGLWQINEIHFATFHVNSRTVLDALTNAKIAVSISGRGTNWAAWCTAWEHPAGNCGHGHLSAPQIGSPAAYQISRVQGALGSGTNIGAPITGGNALSSAGGDIHALTSAFDYLRSWASRWGPADNNTITAYAQAIGRIR